MKVDFQAVVDAFHMQLSENYPEGEVRSFIHRAAEHVSGYAASEVILKKKEEVSEEEWQQYQRIIQALKQQQPIQYILGKTVFYDVKIKVNEHVLIPRPETEELVDWIIKKYKGQQQGLKVLDIGTGSGCIPVTLKKHLPHAEIDALDVSQQALELAKKNARLNDVSVHFFRHDILKDPVDIEKQYDVVVSNPPYVRQSEKQLMQPNVIDHEPHLALFVPEEDPLLFYRAIFMFCRKALQEEGHLFFEINENLAADVKASGEKEGFELLEMRQDMQQKDRMLNFMKS